MGLSPKGNYTPRRAREQRAYRLVVASGTAGTAAVVTFVLAVFGVIGSFAIPVVLAIVAAICFFLFRRIVSPS